MYNPPRGCAVTPFTELCSLYKVNTPGASREDLDVIFRTLSPDLGLFAER